MATLDEVERCPRCDEKGKVVRTDPGRRGGKTFTYNCQNKNCRWYNTGWVISIAADGSIPDPRPQEKAFPNLSEDDLAIGRRIVEDAAGRDLRHEG